MKTRTVNGLTIGCVIAFVVAFVYWMPPPVCMSDIRLPESVSSGLGEYSLKGTLEHDVIYITYKNKQRVSTEVLEELRSLPGIISVEEKDYTVTITKAHHFYWTEILPFHRSRSLAQIVNNRKS